MLSGSSRQKTKKVHFSKWLERVAKADENDPSRPSSRKPPGERNKLNVRKHIRDPFLQEMRRMHGAQAMTRSWKLHEEIYPGKSINDFFLDHDKNKACTAKSSREYVVDSGASFHLISKADLTKAERITLRHAKDVQYLATANGQVVAREEVDVYVQDLDLTVTALVLTDVPPILSLGKLVRSHGCVYEWSKDYQVMRLDGREIECLVRSDVPIVAPALTNDNAGGDSSPGASSSKDALPDLTDIAEEQEESQAKERVKTKVEASKKKKEPPVVEIECVDSLDVPKPEEWEVVESKKRKKNKKPVSAIVEKPVHTIFTHFPKDPDCVVCNSCKCTRSRCMRKSKVKFSHGPKPVEFADAVTADHTIINEEDQSRAEDQVALVITDRATGWEQGYPSKGHTAEETIRAFQHFLGLNV